jgi:hypothetical protein
VEAVVPPVPIALSPLVFVSGLASRFIVSPVSAEQATKPRTNIVERIDERPIVLRMGKLLTSS